MPTHQRLRTDDGEDVQDRREPSVELDKEPTVGVRQPGPTLHLAPQNNQLLSERRILRVKSALRLEWRSQDAQHKKDQRYHAARRADSLTPPTRMRFSAHTAKCCQSLRASIIETQWVFLLLYSCRLSSSKHRLNLTAISGCSTRSAINLTSCKQAAHDAMSVSSMSLSSSAFGPHRNSTLLPLIL